ncbi:hypothetical protein C8R44DRAFT_878668 [Mycena epipterygia]|nr:hypothetical protein C8R44DRAFT_878668 [Mycena epipterygia]
MVDWPTDTEALARVLTDWDVDDGGALGLRLALLPPLLALAPPPPALALEPPPALLALAPPPPLSLAEMLLALALLGALGLGLPEGRIPLSGSPGRLIAEQKGPEAGLLLLLAGTLEFDEDMARHNRLSKRSTQHEHVVYT